MLGAPGTGSGHEVDLITVSLCLFVAYLPNLGIRNAARFETVVVGLKVLLMLGIPVANEAKPRKIAVTGGRGSRQLEQ